MVGREDVAALLELLRTDPAAREQLRSLLRDEHLDRLTASVERLAEAQRRTEERLEALTARVDQLAVRVDQLAEAQRRTEERLEALTARVDQLAVRVDQLAEAQRRTEERLEALTARVDQLAVRVDQLAEAQRRTEERLAQLAEAQRRTEERLEQLAVWVGHLRGESVERRYREHAPAYFSQLAQRVRVLEAEELDRLLDEAVERGALAFDETEDVRRADLVLAGRVGPGGEPVYLIVETSATIEGRDVERAAQRAGSLARAGVRTVPVAAGARITAEAEAAARRLGVWRVLDGRAYPPAAEAETAEA